MTSDGELLVPGGERPAPGRRIRLAMVAPEAEQCGVADYTAHLVDALRPHVDVAWLTQASGWSDMMNEADIVHIQHQYHLFGGVAPWKARLKALAEQITAPTVMTVHEFVEPHGSAVMRTALSWTNRLHFRHPAIRHLIVHTDADKAHLVEAGIASDMVTVIRHGVPTAPPLPARTHARAKLGLDREFVVTIFGFLSRKKGHLAAIAAHAAMPSNVILLLAGGKHPDDDSGYVDEVRAAAERSPAGDRIRITGYLPPEEVAAVMSATDLVLAPFAATSGSGSMAWAFACGKPVLASAIPPHLEMSRACPGSVSLTPAADPAALAEAVASLQRDIRALTKMAEGAKRYAAATSYAHMAEATARVYRAVLEAQG